MRFLCKRVSVYVCVYVCLCICMDHVVKTMPDLLCLRSSNRFMIATRWWYRKITLVGVTAPEEK